VKVLGIETSCDETAAAVVDDALHVHSTVIESSIDQHRDFGGVVPELAGRAHVATIGPVVREALEGAGLDPTHPAIDAVAVTSGPGLIGSLLVGLSAAKTYALAWGIPFVGVNETIDDAAGEAYDKVARWLGLGYPGGPEIDRLAQGGNPDALALPVSMIGDDFDFSFSGLKTAVVRATQKYPDVAIGDVAASFQAALGEQLLRKLRRALERYDVRGVALAGGVAANSHLRILVRALADEFGVVAHLPSLAMCTDNAAMIGAAGLYRFAHDGASALSLSARPNWQLVDVA